MKLVLLLVSIFIPAILSTEHFAKNDLETTKNELRKELQMTGYGGCMGQLSLPLVSMLLADEISYDLTCSATPYFKHCEDQFKAHCKNTGCDLNVKLPWVQSFPAAGNDYICKKVTYQYLNETWENGGAVCIFTSITPLKEGMVKLYNNIWNGDSVNCSSSIVREPIKGMGDIIHTLDSCTEKRLRDLTINYFNQVITDSPCKGQFHFGSGADGRSAVNVGLAVVSMTIVYLATTFRVA